MEMKMGNATQITWRISFEVKRKTQMKYKSFEKNRISCFKCCILHFSFPQFNSIHSLSMQNVCCTELSFPLFPDYFRTIKLLRTVYAYPIMLLHWDYDWWLVTGSEFQILIYSQMKFKRVWRIKWLWIESALYEIIPLIRLPWSVTPLKSFSSVSYSRSHCIRVQCIVWSNILRTRNS